MKQKKGAGFLILENGIINSIGVSAFLSFTEQICSAYK